MIRTLTQTRHQTDRKSSFRYTSQVRLFGSPILMNILRFQILAKVTSDMDENSTTPAVDVDSSQLASVVTSVQDEVGQLKDLKGGGANSILITNGQ